MIESGFLTPTGETTVNPITQAIATALDRAIGVRLREAPLTSERIWRALRARSQEPPGG